MCHQLGLRSPAPPGFRIHVSNRRIFSDLLKNQESRPKQSVAVLRAKTPTEVLVTMQDREAYLADYLGLARTLREVVIATEVYLDPHPLRVQLGYASSMGMPFAVIAGSSELDEDVVLIKDLKHHTQESKPGDDLVRYIKAKLKELAVAL
jgi:histidyl-tRNA synthetase